MAQPKKRPPGRPPSVEVYPGKRFGYCEVIRRVHTKEGPRLITICRAPKKDGSGLCGKQERNPLAYFTRSNGPKTHCGCVTKVEPNPWWYEKRCWNMMHIRCENPKHVAFPHYGGRGIGICERWHKSNPNGFKNFCEDMGPVPKPHEFTVDRRDNDKGYDKSNCRWADKETQANNQRRYQNRS